MIADLGWRISDWRRFVLLVVLLTCCCLPACAIHKVETAKSLYTVARQAQQSGDDMTAAIQWKAVVDVAGREIAAGHYLNTNHFLRASANLELNRWDEAFADLKSVQVESLTEQEFWIHPLYAILMGDYYSHNSMNSVADGFYESVLKKSAWKTSPAYLLALERKINNSIRMIERQATREEDAGKYRMKEYGTLISDLQKYVEDHPSAAVPHFLLSDLLQKTGKTELSLEHLLAAFEMGLPTRDLQRSAEYQFASLLAAEPPGGVPASSAALKTTLLRKASGWWARPGNESVLRAGEGGLGSIDPQIRRPEALDSASRPDLRIRYLAVVDSGGQWEIVAWEEAPL